MSKMGVLLTGLSARLDGLILRSDPPQLSALVPRSYGQRHLIVSDEMSKSSPNSQDYTLQDARFIVVKREL